MVERRKKKLFEMPIINAVIGGLILALIAIPIQMFSFKVNSVYSTPEQIKEVKKEIEYIKEDVCDLKDKNEKLDESINKLEKIVVKLDYIVGRLDK